VLASPGSETLRLIDFACSKENAELTFTMFSPSREDDKSIFHLPNDKQSTVVQSIASGVL